MSSSKSYVIAEYDTETRKIPGDWTNDSYSNLMKKVRLKFHIRPQTPIDIKVYDKNNDKFFMIDSDEMVEIPHAGLIKITKCSKPKAKITKSSLTKPVAVPLPSKPKLSKEEDNALRSKWTINSVVELYSDSMQKWMIGKIISIINDSEGEWLRVRYLKNREKEIQRLNKFIRPRIETVKTANENYAIQTEIEKEEKVAHFTPDTPSSSDASTTDKEYVISTTKFNVDAKPFVPASVSVVPLQIDVAINAADDNGPNAPNTPSSSSEEEEEDKEKGKAASLPAIDYKNQNQIFKQKQVRNIVQKTMAKRRYDYDYAYNYNVNYNPVNPQKQAMQRGQYRMVKVSGRRRGQSRDKIVATYASSSAADKYYYSRRDRSARGYVGGRGGVERQRQRQRQRRRSSEYYGAYSERYPAPAPIRVAVPVISENVCWEFNNIGGCSRGEECQWKHVYVGPPVAVSQKRRGVGGEYNYGKFGTSGRYNICWEFNTIGGCPRGINCQWHHQYLVQ